MAYICIALYSLDNRLAAHTSESDKTGFKPSSILAFLRVYGE